MSLITANNLTINDNLVVNQNILGSGNVQITGNIQANDITSTTDLNAVNLNITGKLNSLTQQNLLSLDTTSSINTALNTINSSISTIQGKQNTDETNITNLQNSVSTIQSKQSTDETNIGNLQSSVSANTTSISNLLSHVQISSGGNLSLETLQPNTTINFGINNSTNMTLDSGGFVHITNALGSANIELNLEDKNTNNSLKLTPYIGATSFNPIVSSGSSAIIAVGNNQMNTGILSLYPWSNTSSGVVINPTSLLIGSGTSTNALPSNYLYFNSSGIGINKTNPSTTLDVFGSLACGQLNTSAIVLNGNLNCTDIYISAGNNNNPLSQQLSSIALLGTTTNTLANQNATAITSLQNQVNALITNSIKACGWITYSINQYIQISGSNYVQSISQGSALGITGVIITLKSTITGVQGIINATCQGDGYTCVVALIQNTNPIQFIVGPYGSGSNAQFINASFFWQII